MYKTFKVEYALWYAYSKTSFYLCLILLSMFLKIMNLHKDLQSNYKHQYFIEVTIFQTSSSNTALTRSTLSSRDILPRWPNPTHLSLR